MTKPAACDSSAARASTTCVRGGLPRRLALALLLLLWCADRAEAQWPDERQAGPFICHADFSLAGFDAFLADMSELQRDLSAALGVQPAREQIHVFLFAHKSTYRNYVGQYFPDVPMRRALYIKERGPGMVFAYRNGEFETDLRHESTHALLHAALPVVPLWLDEGLAEYFEVSRDQRAFDHSHLTPVTWAARFRQERDIESLEQIGALEDMGTSEYRYAWAWVHFMLHGPPEARAELQAFLADLQARTPPGVLSKRLRRRIPDLDSRFRQHFRQWRSR